MPNHQTKYCEEELLTHKPIDQGIPTTCSILSYEVGDAIKCALNIHWGGVRGYQGEARKGIGDSITMLRLLCTQLELDFWDCLREGEEVYIEGESIRERSHSGPAKGE